MNKTLIAALLLSTMSLAPVAVSAQTVTPPGGPVTGTPGTPSGGQFGPNEHGEHGDHHPEMRKAMHHLEEAKAELQKAAHDYSGHRTQAIQMIDQAEQQIHEGIESDHH